MINIKHNFVFFLLILLIVSFCSINAFGEKSTKVNFLGYLKYAVKFETKYPYYLKKARKLFFKDGWDTLGPYPRVIKRDSFFHFYSSSKKTFRVALDIENNNFPRTKENLKIILFLNNHILKTLKIGPKADILIELPKKFVDIGTNRLKFSIKSKVPVRDGVNNNFPGVWLILKKFTFLDIPDKGDEFTRLNDLKVSKFYQPANSEFSLVIDSNLNKSLDFNIELLKKNNPGVLEIIKSFEDGSPEQILKIDLLHRKFYSKNFHFEKKEGKILLTFIFKSWSDQSVLLWKKLDLHSLEDNRKIDEDIANLRIKNLKNIFVIVLDALRFDLLGKKVNGIEITPNINKFSKTAYDFQNYYANAPYTGASIATMFSGLLPEVHGVRKIGSQIPYQVRMLQQYLKKAEFTLHGFTGNPVLLFHDFFKEFDSAELIFNLSKRKKEQSSYNNLQLVINSISNLDKSSKNFYYIHLLPPHKPYSPPSSFKSRFYNGAKVENSGFDRYDKTYINYRYLSYLNNVSYGDHLVGQILTAINSADFFDDSLIILTSDHGEGFAEHNVMEHGITVYNEMIRIPYLMKPPFHDTRIIVDSQFSHLNFTPTISSILGFEMNENWQAAPISFNLNRNKESLYSRATGKKINAMQMSHTYKYIYNSGLEELFNIKKDQHELVNIIDLDAFLKLSQRQKLFMTYFHNLKQKKLMGIKFRNKKIKNWDSELKTLGYL